MDEATFTALALTLTVLGAVATWVAYRRRGLPAGMLGAGLTLLVPAAYLTRTLRLLTRVADAVADWATGLVLSPTVWAGVVLAALGVVLVVASRPLAARGVGVRSGRSVRSREQGPRARRPAVGPAEPEGRAKDRAEDDELADVEALLRRRGIT